MRTNSKKCKNCEESFKADYDFCPHCGMQDKDDLTVGVLFYNAISNYISFDARFFKSFFPLLFKPGFLAEKFIQGKRLLYLHPARMYLFTTIIFFFLFSFVTKGTLIDADKGFSDAIKDAEVSTESVVGKHKDSLARLKIRKALQDNQNLTGMSRTKIDSLVNAKSLKTINYGFNDKKIDSLINVKAPKDLILKEIGMEKDAGYFKRKLYDQFLKFYKQKKVGGILQAFYDSIPLALFVLLPIFALLLKLFYYSRETIAHHLVFSFYFFSFLFMVFSFVLLISLTLSIPSWIQFLILLSTIIYLIFAIKRFYKQSIGLSILKTGVISLIYLLIVLPIAVTMMSLLAFITY